MSAAAHVRAFHRYDHSARMLDGMLRVCLVTGNRGAAQLARENRDTARRLHLDALADALAAGWLPS